MEVFAIVGASPGVGKSTLSRALTEHLRRSGKRVDQFDEADIVSRPQFATVAAAFTATGFVPACDLVDAAAYLHDVAAAGNDAVVIDSLLPFVPSLLAFGHTEQEITAIADDLITRIADLATVAVFLDGDPERALRRAVVREEPHWLDWFGDKLARYGLVRPRPTLAELCECLAYQRDVTLRVLERTPWHLIVIRDAIDQTPQAVVDAVVERLPAA